MALRRGEEDEEKWLNSDDDDRLIQNGVSGTRKPEIVDDRGNVLLDGNSVIEPLKEEGRQEQEEAEAVKDRYGLVYLIFLFHGVGIMLPWNMFITIRTYFTEYKFGGSDTEYSKNFLSYLGIAAQVPNVLMAFTNLFYQVNISLGARITVCLLCNALISMVTILLAIVDSSEWPGWFFVITMVTVVLLNASNGMYQNSFFGLAGDFPHSYTNAVVFGTNISGTFVALVNVLTMAATPNMKMAAIYYFLVALVVISVCFDSYFILPKCRFYRRQKQLGSQKRKEEAEIQVRKALEKGGSKCWTYLKNYWKTLKQGWVQMVNVFLIFFVTLTIFPAMQAEVQRVDPNFFVSERYYAPVFAFLLFNAFAMVGNYVAHHIQFPSPDWLFLPVALRLLMIPYFMFCNYRPALRSWPVYVKDDYAYIGMAVLLAFSSGYLSSLAMMYAPAVVDKDKSRLAGMMAAFFLVFGVFGGIQFTLFVAYVNENMGPLVPAALNGTTF